VGLLSQETTEVDMSHKPNSATTGIQGTVGTAGQSVATTNYSVGSSFWNRTGDRWLAAIISCDEQYDLHVYGKQERGTFSAAGGSGPTEGVLISKTTGNAATTLDGTVHYIQCAGFQEILIVIQQSSGSTATVTKKYQTFNE
jgi:hypothetical protein